MPPGMRAANEAYTGTAVWGRTSKDGKQPEPVRAEGAWEAIVPRELFDKVQEGPRRRGSGRRGWGASSC